MSDLVGNLEDKFSHNAAHMRIMILYGCAKSPEPSLVHMSNVVRKPAFCICENKDADQLRGNREADQRLCFRYIESIISLLSKYEISSL